MPKPVIAIAMGDPSGIGPEIIVKVLASEPWHERCRPFIIGDLAVMQAAARALDLPLVFRAIS